MQYPDIYINIFTDVLTSHNAQNQSMNVVTVPLFVQGYVTPVS